MSTVELIEQKLEDFGLENVYKDTFVFIDPEAKDVQVGNSDFNTFTKWQSTPASFFIDFDGEEATINRQGIEEFVKYF